VPRASQFGHRPPDPVDVAIEFKGQPAMVLRVDKNKVTRQWAGTADEDFYAAVTAVALAWDLVNDDETPYELTKQNWLALELNIADEVDLIEQIVTACTPSRAEGNALSEPSSTLPTDSAQLQQTLPNGAAISQLQKPSESPSPT
jgi:hypothetical protein